jgi:hypothetical protein
MHGVMKIARAFKDYFTRWGFFGRGRRLRITPAKTGSGAKDASIDHDRYLAGR